MSLGPDQPRIEFRATDPALALESARTVMAGSTYDEVDGLDDVDPAQLTPAARGTFLVAYVAGRPAATGGYRTHAADPSGDTAEMIGLLVRPGARRAGVGRLLLAELEELALDDEYRWVVIEVAAGRRAARALFEVTGYRRDTGGAERVTYRKDLPDD